MSTPLFILGAADPEMAAIESLLHAAGVPVAYALDGSGEHVTPATAYQAARLRWRVHAMTTFGTHLRQHRQRAGLTQAALADAAGLSATFVAMLERGEKSASLRTAMRLAQALGVTLDELTGESSRRKRD